MLISTTEGVMVPFAQIGVLEPQYPRGRLQGVVYVGRTLDDSEEFTIPDHALRDTILAMVPAEGWECLLLIDDDHGRPDSFSIEPLMAVGLNCFGRPVMISPETVMLGSNGANLRVLRHIASGKVFADRATFDSADACLIDFQASFDERAEEGATE